MKSPGGSPAGKGDETVPLKVIVIDKGDKE